MASWDSRTLIISTRDGDCTAIHEGVSLLAGCHSNVRKLFRKLVESAGTPLDYDYLERELFDTEPRGPQGAYNTKNAVRTLRTALFPFHAPDGQQKWKSEIVKDGIALLRLEKPHASRICLTFPLPVGNPEVFIDVDPPSAPAHLRATLAMSAFTVPMARSKQFYGRDGLLMDLHDRLISSAGACVAICGAGGLGKTQLSVEYAHINRDSYPGGVFWIDAKDFESVQEEYALLSRDIDELHTPQDLPIEEIARRVRERLHQLVGPSLLILDSLQPDEKLLQLLPTTGLCRILATTRRNSLLKPRFHIINVPELDAHSSLMALQSCCTIEQTADRMAAQEPGCIYDSALEREQAAIEGICSDLNQRLPLTLTLIAFYVDQRKTTFEECRRRLKENSLKVFERAEVAYSIHDAFKISRSELTAEAMRVLATAACFVRKNISLDLLRGAAYIGDVETFEDAIALLDRSSFVYLDKTGRLTIHDLVRDMTLQQIEPMERDQLLVRTAEVLTSTLIRANESMVWDAVRWEIVQSRAVVDTCRRHRLHAPLAALLFELGHYYRLHDETESALGHFDEAARIVAAYMPDAMRLLAKCKMQICASDPFSPVAITYAKQALAITRAAAEYGPAEVSEYYDTVGYALKMNGRPWRALPFYRRALELCESELGHGSAKSAEYLNNISALYEGIGDYRKAAEYIVEARNIFLHVYGSEHRLFAISLNTLGRIQLRLGEREKSLESHRAARQIFGKLYGTETKDYAMSLYFEGVALAALGQSESSSTNVSSALEILERKYGVDDAAARRVRQSFESGGF